MMSSETVSFSTRGKSYDKIVEKKDENPSSDKVPSTSSPSSSSNGPLMNEKTNIYLILRPPKATLRKVVFNHNSQAAQFYNVVEDLS